MATAKQRQRRLDRRHTHQAKTRTAPTHAAVQKGGVLHIFPHQKAAIEAFATAKSLAESMEITPVVSETIQPQGSPRVRETFTQEQLQSLVMADILPIAAANNIKGRSKMKKSELIDAIMEAQS